MSNMLAITLPNDVEERLTHMAKVTGKTKTYYAREAILNYLEDLEDTYLSLSILEKSNKRYSQQEMEENLDWYKKLTTNYTSISGCWFFYAWKK